MKTNHSNYLPQTLQPKAFKVCALLMALVATDISLLPAAQLTLKQNRTPQVGGGFYQGVTDSWMNYQDRYNYGADYDLYAGEYQNGVGDSIILKFDLPGVTCQTIPTATLSLWYVDSYQMNYNSTAIQIAPFRIKPGYSWYENNGGSGGGHSGGLANHGVNYYYRDAADTLPWTDNYAGFYDSVDDGNGRQWIKRTGGSVPYAYAPQQWVPFDVRPSVTNWYGGTENNGLGLYMQGCVGTDSTADGDFASKENPDYGPTLVITYSGAQIAWTGSSSSTWDALANNWNVGGYLGIYGDGDFVTFADGAANPTISVTGTGVSPGSMMISNAATAYSFSAGSINGSGTLTKQGSGQATLAAANGYSGPTLVKNGLLVISASGALGTAGGGTIVSNGAALAFQNVNYTTAEPVTISGGGGGGGVLYALSGNNTFAGPVTLAANSTVGVGTSLYLTLNGAIGGGFSFTKTGSGTLTFGGADGNTYGGTTYVNQGTLALGTSAAVPNSPVFDIASGATFDVSAISAGFPLGAGTSQTLKGSGQVRGDVNAGSQARIGPGDGVGTLVFLNDLALAAGVTNYFELTNSPAIGGGTNDLITVAGDLTVHNNVIAITVLGPNPLGAGTWRLFNYAGAKSGAFSPTPVFLSGSAMPGLVTIDESVTNQVNLVIVPFVATSLVLTSSRNPSLPGANVTFTATVSPVPPATNVPTGTVIFRTNNIAMGPPVELVGGVAALTTASLAHGFTTVQAEYASQGQFIGSTNSLVQLINTPPVPGYHLAAVLQNQPLVLPFTDLLSLDSDPDNDLLTITSVSQLSPNGGVAAIVGNKNITYLPRPDFIGKDQLTYTLADPYTSVTVTVAINVVSVLTNNVVAITNPAAGSVLLTCTGVPGWTYWLQAATNLDSPIYWAILYTNLADTNGVWQFTDASATNAGGFYRSLTHVTTVESDLYDAEILSMKIAGGNLPAGFQLRESPTLRSPGVTDIQPQPDFAYIITSFFDVFTELSADGGLSWFPATNGPALLVLVGGLPPNEFPSESLPPLGGQYITPPAGRGLYPQGIILKDLRMHDCLPTFLPPPPRPGELHNINATVELFVSWDGGLNYFPFTAPAQLVLRITARPPY